MWNTADSPPSSTIAAGPRDERRACWNPATFVTPAVSIRRADLSHDQHLEKAPGFNRNFTGSSTSLSHPPLANVLPLTAGSNHQLETNDDV